MEDKKGGGGRFLPNRRKEGRKEGGLWVVVGREWLSVSRTNMIE
jgi:hypothetical protein